MKRLRFISLSVGCMVLAVSLGFGAYRVANDYLSDKAHSASQQCADSRSHHYVVMITHSQVVPQHTSAKRCDELTITNRDSTTRLMAFGEPNRHASYDGVSERLLSQGQSLSVTLIKTGTFSFHDHLDDEHVVGSFTVTN